MLHGILASAASLLRHGPHQGLLYTKLCEIVLAGQHLAQPVLAAPVGNTAIIAMSAAAMQNY